MFLSLRFRVFRACIATQGVLGHASVLQAVLPAGEVLASVAALVQENHERDAREAALEARVAAAEAALQAAEERLGVKDNEVRRGRRSWVHVFECD